MTIMVTRSKEKHRDRSDISRVDFAEPLVTLHTLQPWVQGEALVGACTGRESTLEAWGEGGRAGGGGGCQRERRAYRVGGRERSRAEGRRAYREGVSRAELSGGSGAAGAARETRSERSGGSGARTGREQSRGRGRGGGGSFES